jgi:hypothetical protein
LYAGIFQALISAFQLPCPADQGPPTAKGVLPNRSGASVGGLFLCAGGKLAGSTNPLPINRLDRRIPTGSRALNFNPHGVIMDPLIVVFVVPTAIVAWAAYAATQSVIRHRERMAKIEHGIAPDAKETPK